MADRDELLSRAQGYAIDYLIEIIENPPLGWGQDGFVWKVKSANTAVKVFERKKSYEIERECYMRLAENELTKIGIFEVPRLIGHSDQWMAIEMSVVKPPYLIDFGKARLDRPPDFDPDVMAEIEADREELWGDRYGDVLAAVWKLKKLGIYYTDVTPRNIVFKGWEPAL